MSEDIWSAQDTTPDAIDDALRELLRERHAADAALVPARVLNLIVIVDRDWKGEVANRLERVGRYHASRTILCAVQEGRTTLDATAVMRYEDPDGGLGVMHEQVEIDIGPGHLARLDTIVDPVLVSELHTVVWSPHGHDDGVRALAGMIDVMLLDSDDVPERSEGLARAADALERSYVVDLAWLRTTPWRERLAAAFDPQNRRPYLDSLGELAVRHRPSSSASGLLLAGWLAARLQWEPRALEELERGGMRGDVGRNGDRVTIELEPVEQEAPGLAGVTVASPPVFSLSLDRSSGGLRARQQLDGSERVWRVLGASRGEGGILGEGVRQALLRDPAYEPALRAARTLCP